MALIEATGAGLYCAAGDFHVDPVRRVSYAVTTHAHSDHARAGSARYLTAECGVALLRERVGNGAAIQGVGYGETVERNGVRISLHPAGHVLGSAQVRVEYRGEVWVISGDYKLQADPTCAPFEPLRCHTFVTEATFGTPVYRWPDPAGVIGDINEWWRENQRARRTSVILAYALGKAQRLIASVDASIGPILVHGAVGALLPAYEAGGVTLPLTRTANRETVGSVRGQGLVIAPPSAAGTRWLGQFGDTATARASGWMATRRGAERSNADVGFVLSDHADWDGLLQAIEATQCEHVLVTHGDADVLVSWLRGRGWRADEIVTRFAGKPKAGSARNANDQSSNGKSADAQQLRLFDEPRLPLTKAV